MAEPVAETPPAPKPAQPTLVEQYDIGDEAPPPQVGPETPAAGDTPPAAASAQHHSAEQPRDQAGRFTHPPLLVQSAKKAGISDEDILGSNSADLREAIRDARIEQLIAARTERVDTAVQQQQQAVQQQAPPPAHDPLEDQFAPELVEVIRSNRELMAKVAAMEKQLAAVHGHQQEQLRESVAQRLDREFTALNLDLLGKGRASELGASSMELTRRRVVITEAQRLAGKDANLEAVARKIGEAARGLFGLNPPAAPPANPPAREPTPADIWNQGGLALPTHRLGANEPDGRSKAEKTVASYLRGNGVANHDSQTSLADELP